MKVHTSNYKIVGFTESVSREALVELGKKHSLPVIEDLGSGALVDLEQYGIHDEPHVVACLNAGIDILCFSGDKLLGGAQAGIILGRKQYIDILKKHPLLRAMRVDKMTLAALEATLQTYLDKAKAEAEIPVLAMLCAKPQALLEKAQRLQQACAAEGLQTEVVEAQSQVGGGSTPTQTLPGYAVAVSSSVISPDVLNKRLHQPECPVVGRIWKDRFLLDVRTIREEEMAYVAKAVAEACR